VTPRSSALSPPAFASPEAGFEYFVTEAHYRSLAGRIIAALGGFGVIVVTGDPPASALTLAPLLREVTGSRYNVIRFLDATELGGHDLSHLRSACSTSPTHHDAIEEEPGSRAAAPLLVICDNTLQLSDEGIEEVFKAIFDRRIGAAVLLTQSGFLARLERPALRFWLTKRLLVARLRFEELGADEIAAFICHQWGSGEGEGVFTPDAITAIASVSGGDPMVVNRFSRRLLDCAAVTTGDRFAQAAFASAATEPMEIPSRKRGIAILDEPSIRMWRGSTVALKLSVGTASCLACVALAAALVVRPAEEKIAGSNLLMTEAAVNVPNAGPSLSEDIRSGASVAASAEPTLATPPEALVGTVSRLAATGGPAPAGGTQQEAPALAAPLDGPTTPAPAASPTGSVPTGAAVHSIGISQEASTVPLAPAAPPRLSTADLAALRARGDRMFALGDVSSARLLYEHAADAGDGQAALKLGKTFDPVALYFARLYGMRGDADMAAYWYRRARDLGETEVK
jgi:hypothetical protein